MSSVQECCYQHEGTLNKFLIDDKGMLFLLVGSPVGSKTGKAMESPLKISWDLNVFFFPFFKWAIN